ncbi:RING finger protein 37-like [Anoplophora glabripennis]|uniref:RING finger protein 37-like n=1 Tax=Anoplophora glabripennis TaxID=217634 RepID=UPI000C792CCC|nr:RING finger protein 37-like [Anoplophora glabripennis]
MPIIRFLLSVATIKIIIFRTEKSVPCLSSVEVWGKTSRTCSAVTRDTISRIMQKSNQDATSNITNAECIDFKIPEDFKDDLTYEIMSIPMTLPSGKTIDQTTLEKHINSEISFGRKPCDPFTGVKFSNTLKPVLNVALKSRIDMFLLQNSHREELANVKRTLGGSGQIMNSLNGCNKRKRETVDVDELDELISKTKQSPSFLNFSSENSDKNLCSRCKVETETMYEIPCKHFYCRTCVLIIYKDLKCLICGKSFKKNDVRKCHL